MQSVQYSQQTQSVPLPQQIQKADIISQLPADNTNPTHNELKIVDTLFKHHGGEMNSIFNEAKDTILIGIIFIALSLPTIDNIIRKLLPVTEKSEYFLIFAKSIVFMLLYWVVKHFYLSRQS